MEVTLNLPENVYQNFADVAKRTRRRISDVIVEKIQTDYWIENFNEEKSLSDLSDAEVLELAKLKLSKQQDRRMSQLLDGQRERQITIAEKLEIEGLLNLYRLSNLRKAQGCLEAVKRGLIKTPADLK